MSPKMIRQYGRDVLKDIDLIVYDMAGTVVQEGGLVYQTLRKCMVDDGIEVSEEAMHPWHGAKKEAVIEHFAKQSGTPDSEMEERVVRIGDNFVNSIEDAYFAEASPIDHVQDGCIFLIKTINQNTEESMVATSDSATMAVNNK